MFTLTSAGQVSSVHVLGGWQLQCSCRVNRHRQGTREPQHHSFPADSGGVQWLTAYGPRLQGEGKSGC